MNLEHIIWWQLEWENCKKQWFISSAFWVPRFLDPKFMAPCFVFHPFFWTWLHGMPPNRRTGARMLKWVKCRRLSTTSCPNSPSRSAIWTLGMGRDRRDRCGYGPEMSRVTLDPPKWMVSYWIHTKKRPILCFRCYSRTSFRPPRWEHAPHREWSWQGCWLRKGCGSTVKTLWLARSSQIYGIDNH